MASQIVLSTIILIVLTTLTTSYKILVFSPQFGSSHVTFMGNIADTLVKGGHNVTILMPEMSNTLKRTGTKFAKVIKISSIKEATDNFSTKKFLESLWAREYDLFSLYKQGAVLRLVFGSTCKHINAQTELLDQLKSERFDLGVTEIFDACSIGLIELLRIPAHLVTCPSSVMDPLASLLGIPLFPSYVPASFSRTTEHMTYLERLHNFMAIVVGKLVFNGLVDYETQIFRQFYGSNFIDLREKIAQASFVLTNGEPLLDFPHPTISKVIEIGGLSIPEPRPLDKYWESVVKKRNKVILMSFGSVAQSQYMPEKLKKIVLNTFAQFPEITFIWKYEWIDLDLKNYSNVIISKWIPQNDLLNNPRVVAFMTHAGMNSVIETATKGIPMIAIPLFAEQKRNAQMVKRAGIGTILRMVDFGKEGELRKSILLILNDATYSQKARKLAKMIAKKPLSPKQILLKHAEFAAEFGQLPNLDPIGRTLPFYKLYMLDIFVPLLISVALFITSTMFVFYRIVKSLMTKVQKVKIQ